MRLPTVDTLSQEQLYVSCWQEVEPVLEHVRQEDGRRVGRLLTSEREIWDPFQPPPCQDAEVQQKEVGGDTDMVVADSKEGEEIVLSGKRRALSPSGEFSPPRKRPHAETEKGDADGVSVSLIPSGHPLDPPCWVLVFVQPSNFKPRWSDSDKGARLTPLFTGHCPEEGCLRFQLPSSATVEQVTEYLMGQLQLMGTTQTLLISCVWDLGEENSSRKASALQRFSPHETETLGDVARRVQSRRLREGLPPLVDLLQRSSKEEGLQKNHDDGHEGDVKGPSPIFLQYTII